MKAIKYPCVLLMVFFCMCSIIASAQDDNFFVDLLKEKGSDSLKAILARPDVYRYQLIYTKIDRTKNNKPHFTHFRYRVNKDEYFNPASMVKMPVAFLALEKMNGLAGKGVDKFTPMITDSSYSHQSRVLRDTSAESGLPSVAHYIKKIFLISDNDAYNRLYEFNGQQFMNERLWKMGYRDMRITPRFVTMNEDENRHTNKINFVKGGDTIYLQPAAYSPVKFDLSKQILIGKAHYSREEKL
ncbi:MAG TPA: serine hydrolase, partial [Flavitalea sp.]|nr:serine hydrolase [Flavitalea sp.]